VPEEDDPFTLTKGDLPLIEAGIRKIPWLASPIPVYEDWGAGGILVTDENWKTAIKELAENPTERKTLGEAGFEKAKERESTKNLQLWKEVLQELS